MSAGPLSKVTVFNRLAGNRQVLLAEAYSIRFIGLTNGNLSLTGKMPIKYLLITVGKIIGFRHIVTPVVRGRKSFTRRWTGKAKQKDSENAQKRFAQEASDRKGVYSEQGEGAMKRERRTAQPGYLVHLLIPFALVFVLAVRSGAVEVGEKAPDFELRSTTGDKIRLSDFAGKKNVLIEFYIMDFNPGCEEAHQTRRLAYEEFQAKETEILGISVFNPYAQQAFAKTLDLPYPLLSDFPHLKTIKKYNVENQIGEITTAKRAYFIVDKQGVVRFKRIMTPFDVDGPYLENEALLHELDRINQKAASRR